MTTRPGAFVLPVTRRGSELFFAGLSDETLVGHRRLPVGTIDGRVAYLPPVTAPATRALISAHPHKLGAPLPSHGLESASLPLRVLPLLLDDCFTFPFEASRTSAGWCLGRSLAGVTPWMRRPVRAAFGRQAAASVAQGNAATLWTAVKDNLRKWARSPSEWEKSAWYLAGSLAAREHTVDAQGLLSDVDLVCHRSSLDPGWRSPDVAESVSAALASIPGGPSALRVGVAHVSRQSGKSGIEGTMSGYFARYMIPLTDGARVQTQILEPVTLCRPWDYQREVFRWGWTRLARAQFRGTRLNEYEFMKGVLLEKTVLDDNHPPTFLGYRRMRAKVVRRFVASDCVDPHLACYLAGLDAKLNLGMPVAVRPWSRLFSAALLRRLERPDIDWRIVATLRAAIALHQREPVPQSVSSDLERIADRAQLGATGRLIREAVVSGSTDSMWLALFHIRAFLAPDEVELCAPKFRRMVAVLSSRCSRETHG